jgi:hypothetical protein
MMDSEQLGRVAYEVFQARVGEDPARLSWNALKPYVQEKWISVAAAVARVVKEQR